VLLILIIGGTGYLYGGLVGALIYRLLQDFLSSFSARYWQYWIGFVLIMMVLFGRIYGGIIAGLIIGATIWLDLSSTTSFLVMGVGLLALGLVRETLVKWIALTEQQAVHWFRRMWPGPKLKVQESSDHGAGA
jgi:hypothetical protein